MRRSRILWGCGLFIASVVGTLGAPPVSVVVTLRGKRYEVKDATSVSDIQNEVERVAGLAKDKQALLFKGKKLEGDASLSDAGVQEGDTINVVPNSKKQRPSGPPASSSIGIGVGVDGEDDEEEGVEDSAAGMGASGAFPGLSGLSGLGGLGGLGGMGGGVPKIPGMPDLDPQAYQQLVTEMLQSPIMDEFLSDPEKIEQSRQAILQQPQLKEAMAAIPGFSELVDDPEKWRESMQMAKDLYAAQREMLKQQQGQSGGAGSFPPSADVDDLDDEL